ncbi:MAG: hypothetical protein Q9191_005944 [Dirinaria sp. TL-2023a]
MASSFIFILAAASFNLFCRGELSLPFGGAADGFPHHADVQQAAKKLPSCCNVLSHFLPGKVSSHLGVAYNISIASYWSAQEQEVSPSCVFIPKSAQDVSVAVFILGIASNILSTDNGCKFAVRSGGHTPFASSANIQNGVTIDLQSLNPIDVASDNQTVFIGPGNRWVDVYLKLDAMGLATSGGRVSDVGVGGLTLGASGELTNANANENPDLFKALKGGSNNFGVVTGIKLRLFPQGKFWGGFIGQSISTRFAQFQAFEKFASSAHYDPYAALINSYSYTAASGWIIASNYEYTKPEPYPDVFKPFTDLPQVFNTMRISNLSDFTIELATRSPLGGRYLFITGTFKNNAQTMQKYFDLANGTIQNAGIEDVVGLVFSLSFQPLPQTIISKATASGGNSLGLDASDGDLVNILLTVQWKLPADDARIVAAAQALFEKGKTASQSAGTFNPYLYLNYAAAWQKPIAGYGDQSQKNLQRNEAQIKPSKAVRKLFPTDQARRARWLQMIPAAEVGVALIINSPICIGLLTLALVASEASTTSDTSPLEQASGPKLAAKKEKPNGSVKLKKVIAKNTKPKDGEGSEPKTRANTSSPTPSSPINEADLGKPIEGRPDYLQCKHCKKPTPKAEAPSHVKLCEQKKKEKARKKKEAKELKAAQAKEKEKAEREKAAEEAGEDPNAASKPAEEVNEVSAAGETNPKTAKKSAGKAAADGPKTTKKRKVDGDGDKEPKKKKLKKDEPPKPKLPKPKGPVDVEKQCGVLLPNGGYCARSLTCKSHSMGAKRAVPGRSLPYDILLASYQKKNQAKQQSEFKSFLFPTHSHCNGNPMKAISTLPALEDLISCLKRSHFSLQWK